MTRAIREYATARPTGVPIEDYDLLQALRAAVQALRVHPGFAWEAEILHTPEDVENAWLKLDEVLAATGGKLPAMWVNFTFDLEDQTAADFAAIEQQFGLVLLGMEIRPAKEPKP
ncbi:MAG: hypothetical protein E6J90_50520 [Deltaproteobacteria bacterium]|nr:MAG: hypothetical protein E6J90_50520 [Deltaproteobacteria bacterium]TMQ07453.1 MAG: hypothetical protein E6J91_35460 [Deltaproteobacteria bacterium]